jgi:sigma-E factor negative regulatory protein RseB
MKFGVLLSSLIMPALVIAGDPPEIWLERMQQAVENTNYEGTLLHMSQGRMEQFRVYHRVANNTVTERLVLVDGMGAEIIRTPDEVICIFPKQRSVVIESRQTSHVSESPLRASLPAIADMVPDYYDLTVMAAGRIAERQSQVVSIEPKDGFRYGYRLWLDQETAMPLKSQLIGEDETMPLEEIRFVSVSLPDEVAEAAVQPSIDTSDFSVARHSKAPLPSGSETADISWQASELPPGFMLSVSRFEYLEGESEPRMHLVYTDGLASVSVFLDAAMDASEKEEGFATMGAANAYSVMKEGLLVTAMGEVPAQTVEQIAVSMRNMQP